MIYIDIIFNLSLLVSLSIISGFIENRWPKHTRLGVLIQGVLFGGAAILGMLHPLDMGQGLIFDGRSVMLSLCALFYGPWAGVFAGIMTVIVRINMGGIGMIMGVSVITSSVVIGLLARSFLKSEEKPPSTRNLYLFGIVVHLAMIALMFTLGVGPGLAVMKRIGLPVIILYPLATILVGKILSDQETAIRFVNTLQRTKQNLDVTLQSIGDAVISTDLESKIVLMNPVAEMLTGWKSADARGKPLSAVFNIINSKSREPAKNPVRKALASGKIAGLANHTSLISRDGTERDITDSASPIRDASGVIIGVVLVFRDVTEEYRAQRALQESEEKHRLLIENSHDIIYTLTANGEFLFVSPAWTLILGHPVNQIMGQPFQHFVHTEDIPGCMVFLQKVIEGQSQTGVEYRVQHMDGSWRWHTSNAVPLKGENGKIIGLEGIARDITERKYSEEEKTRLEAQLLQAQKMEAVGRLAGGVAHDFNNILTIILANAEMAMLSDDSGHSVKEDISEIRKAAERASDLTRQLLAFARKQTITPKILDLNDTISGMLKMLRRLIGEDINLVWKPGPNLWPVKMDPSQIDQILANLSVNARDAINGVGNLTIETENAIFNETYCTNNTGFIPGEYTMLAVSDTGSGMDSKTLEQVFDPFFTTKDVGKGTGLGLATVYGAVKQNNGFINVYSEPGIGTIFKIYFPRVYADLSVMPQTSYIEPSLGKETVLLAEDEVTILRLGQTILERHGYTVLAAQTPNELLTLAEKHEGPIHLLITDVVMPEMNGKELRNKIAIRWPEIKTLFMSGYTADVIAHNGVIDEGVHFLQKPFSVTTLVSKVREALDK